jgi:hypothetical protein
MTKELPVRGPKVINPVGQASRLFLTLFDRLEGRFPQFTATHPTARDNLKMETGATPVLRAWSRGWRPFNCMDL